MATPPSQWVTALGLVAVAALWGCTNPLLNKASRGMEQRPTPSPPLPSSPPTTPPPPPRNLLRRLASDTAYLLTNWRFVLPFAINQAGSALFLVALSHAGQPVRGMHRRSAVWGRRRVRCRQADGVRWMCAVCCVSEMSLVVPLTNSLTFVFTAVTSMWLGEAQTHNPSQAHSHISHMSTLSFPSHLPHPCLPPLLAAAVWLGVSLIVLGTGVCLASKQPP